MLRAGRYVQLIRLTAETGHPVRRDEGTVSVMHALGAISTETAIADDLRRFRRQ